MEEINSLVVCTVLADNINIELEKFDVKDDEAIFIRIDPTFSNEDYNNLLKCLYTYPLFVKNKYFLLSRNIEFSKLTLHQLEGIKHEIDSLMLRCENDI